MQKGSVAAQILQQQGLAPGQPLRQIAGTGQQLAPVAATVIPDAAIQTQVNSDLNDAQRVMDNLYPILMLRAKLREGPT